MTSTWAPAPWPAAADISRWLGAAFDAAGSAAAGRPVQLRVDLSPGDVRAGRIGRVRATIEDAELGGLVVARLAVDARDGRLVPGWPPRMRTGPVRIRIEVHQPALDAWIRAAALPIRLRLRSGGLAVRTGLAGVRLAEVRAAVEIDRGRLVVTPSHGEVLGIGLLTPPIRVPLPIPALPRSTRLVALDVEEGRGTFELEVASLEEPIDGELIRQVWRLRSLGSATSRESGSDHGSPVQGRRERRSSPGQRGAQPAATGMLL